MTKQKVIAQAEAALDGVIANLIKADAFIDKAEADRKKALVFRRRTVVAWRKALEIRDKAKSLPDDRLQEEKP